jgi:hypothetical protein
MTRDEIKDSLHSALAEADHDKAFDSALKVGIEKALAQFAPGDARQLACARREALREFGARMGWDD